MATTANAQYNLKENGVWAFGIHAGLNFNGGTPVPILTNMLGYLGAAYWLEGSASVCDTSGSLLFYCSADTIWNKNGQVMPNGYRLMHYQDVPGHDTTYFGYNTTQGAAIAPVIGHADQYYVFSLEASNDFTNGDLKSNRLFYSIVDMGLNGGLGDVVTGQKSIELDSVLSEKMITVPGDNCDIWLLVHSRDTNIFKAYNVSSGGINTTPVVSQVGSLHVFANSWAGGYTAGVMKCSPDRRKLVLSNGCDFLSTVGGAELFTFDPATGKVDSSIGIVNDGTDTVYNGFVSVNKPYGACFSPDNSKLYIETAGAVYQYDLNSFTIADIKNSRFPIDTNIGIFPTDIKIGPDSKLYFNNLRSHDSISRIDYPNLGGMACHYVPDAIALLNNSQAFYGLPNEYVKPRCAVGVSPAPMKEELRIYPNPVNDEMVIESGEAGAVSVYNVLGQVVYSAILDKGKTVISSRGFVKGMYFVELVYGEGVREVRRVVK